MNADLSVTGMPTYESRLQHEPRWALAEASRFFEEASALQDTLRRVAQRLDELGIPCAVGGGLALFAHGYRRFTEDVDLLVTPEGLGQAHKGLAGLGYVRLFAGSKNLRDGASRVQIKFLVTGQYPGDGKPKPVAFPDPAAVAVEKDGVRYLSLPSLVELKLASGMTAPARLKDISDVIELIKLLDLAPDFSEKLAPFVREKYSELWRWVRAGPKRFVRPWGDKRLTPETQPTAQVDAAQREAAELLAAMRADGVVLEPGEGGGGERARLVTTDPAIAKKYDMHEESEFWDEDDEGGGPPPQGAR